MKTPRRETLVAICAICCVANLIFIGALAATNTLKTTQSDDVSYARNPADITTVDIQTSFRISEDSEVRFVIEHPTDVDVFYNVAVSVRQGGPMYRFGYRYAPSVYALILPLSFHGYSVFKLLWTALLGISVAGGTWLLLRAECDRRRLSLRSTAVLAVASLGFTPMISNFKTGQVTPFVYFAVAVYWYGVRRGGTAISGGAVAVPALLKPYFASTLFVSLYRRNIYEIVAFAGVYVVAMIAAMAFGVDVIVEYYRVIFEHAIGNTGNGSFRGVLTFSEWSVNAVRPLFFLGSFAAPVRLAIGAGFLICSVQQRVIGSEIVSFALAVSAGVFMFAQTTMIDYAILLAPLVVLGVTAVNHSNRVFGAVIMSVVLLIAHPYYMETLIGRGHPNIVSMLDSGLIVNLFFALAQPGLIAFYLFAYIIYQMSGVSAKSNRNIQ